MERGALPRAGGRYRRRHVCKAVGGGFEVWGLRVGGWGLGSWGVGLGVRCEGYGVRGEG